MSTERLRLFVALELPERARQALVRWRAPVAGDLRPVSPDALHLTLCFLGWQDSGAVKAIAAACDAVASMPSAELTVGEGIWLPSRRPRVLAVELSGSIAGVQSALSDALAAGGFYVAEKRPFLAHVTVARVPRHARVARSELPPTPPLRFNGSDIVLFRSHLSPAGARYEPLHMVRLS